MRLLKSNSESQGLEAIADKNTPEFASLSIGHRYLLAILSGAMSSVAFLDHQLYGFTWVCLIPLLFAIDGVTSRRAYGLGLLAGFTNFLSATYWIMDFIMLSKGYGSGSALFLAVLFWLYSAQLFAISALLFRWLNNRTQIHTMILFPLVVSTVFASFPMLFPYRFADSQVEFAEILQAIEYTGPFGLEALIVLINAFFFWLLKVFLNGLPKARSTLDKLGLVSPVVIAMLWYGYGVHTLEKWQLRQATWPVKTIGLVQPNETPSTERDVLLPGYMRGYPPEMAMTEQLVAAGAEFVIWPEARYKGVLDNPHVAHAYLEHIRRLDTPLMFQDIQESSEKVLTTEAKNNKHNMAILIEPGSEQIQQYQKMKLIPFGESVPWVSDNPVLRSWAEQFLGEFLNEMQAGQERSLFQTDDLDVIPLICYETVFPDFVAQSVMYQGNEQQSTKPRFIVALSSNGWFGSSHQPYQHVMPSILRAIENRIPLIHVVNNGPSIVASPAGEVLFTSEFQAAGGFLAELYLPRNAHQEITFYSQYPMAFVTTLRIFMAVLIIFALLGFAPRQPDSPLAKM